jgi:hypothetical protein
MIAAIVGSIGGAAAGLWSVRRRTPTSAPAAQKPAASVVAGSPSASPAANAPSATLEPRVTQSVDAAVQPVPVPTKDVAGAMPAEISPAKPAAVGSLSDGDDDEHVLQRARALAQRPDVNALLALRDGASRRAAERGEKESAATRRLLDDLDRYLTEARQLRLKLDRDEFQKTIPTPNRPK